MRILDKYILKHIIAGYCFILSVFVGFYLFIDISSNLSDFLKTKPPLYILLSYYLNMLPLIFFTVSPYALLISILFTLGELNKNNEILSMRASGISVLRLSLPIIFFTLIISFSSLLLQEKVMIKSQKRIEDIKLQFVKKDFSRAREEKNFAFLSEDMIFFVGKFSPKNNTLQNAIIFKEDENNIIVKKLVCRKIVYKDNQWIGKDVMEYKLDSKGNIIGFPLSWEKKNIELKEKPEKLIIKKNAMFYSSSLKSLRKEMARLKKIKAYGLLSNLTIDYHRKLTTPFSHLFLVIGILPFALEIKKRKVALSSLGIGLLFGFVYYCFGSFGIALGKAGILLPIFSAWLAPLFFLTIGITGLALIK
jgi:lipopolysaccharide export system permease protein